MEVGFIEVTGYHGFSYALQDMLQSASQPGTTDHSTPHVSLLTLLSVPAVACHQVFPPRASGSRPPVLLQTLEKELLEASNAASRLASAGPHQQRDPKLAANLSLDVHRQVGGAAHVVHTSAALQLCFKIPMPMSYGSSSSFWALPQPCQPTSPVNRVCPAGLQNLH